MAWRGTLGRGLTLFFFCSKSALGAPDEAQADASPTPAPPAWLKKAVHPDRNRAPEWPATLDFENGSAPTEPGRHVDVRRGRELEFRLTATDPEGDPIRYSAEDLPPGEIGRASCRERVWSAVVGRMGG